jgi:hypothetical protein
MVALPSRAAAVPSAQCAALGGNPASPAGVCEIDTLVAQGGVFTVPESLHLIGTGKIDVAPPGLTVNVGGHLLMETGSLIDGSITGCGTGLPIKIVANDEVTIKNGSTVRSNSCSGGSIYIESKTASVEVDGLLESVGTASGTGAIQAPGGGPITVDAGCLLTVADTGIVRSHGGDPGADLVHLQGGCKVNIYGFVESSGVGHGVPNNPKNHCDGTYRPGKPANSTACVEVWAGDSLTIDNTAPHKGEIKADTGGTGGSSGTSWVDLFARGDIRVTGDTSGTVFDVHANGLAGTNDSGGTITVRSVGGSIRASGNTFQADATGAGGHGGLLAIEATLAANLDDAVLFARGDMVGTGGFGFGGTINVRSFSGNLSWQDTTAPPLSTGDVRPSGSGVPFLNRGVIALDTCATGTATITGTLFSYIGGPIAPTVTLEVGCGGAPTLPTYVTLPNCICRGCVCMTRFSIDGNILTIVGDALKSVAEVFFNTTCDPAGTMMPKSAFLSQSDTAITLDLPPGTSGKHVILHNAAAGASVCSAETLP